MKQILTKCLYWSSTIPTSWILAPVHYNISSSAPLFFCSYLYYEQTCVFHKVNSGTHMFMPQYIYYYFLKNTQDPMCLELCKYCTVCLGRLKALYSFNTCLCYPAPSKYATGLRKIAPLYGWIRSPPLHCCACFIS